MALDVHVILYLYIILQILGLGSTQTQKCINKLIKNNTLYNCNTPPKMLPKIRKGQSLKFIESIVLKSKSQYFLRKVLGWLNKWGGKCSRQQNWSSACYNTCDFFWFDCQLLLSYSWYKQYKAQRLWLGKLFHKTAVSMSFLKRIISCVGIILLPTVAKIDILRSIKSSDV